MKFYPLWISILIEYDPQNISETTFELDFYVEWEQ